MTNLYRPDYLPRLTPTPNAFALNTPQDATTYHPMTRTQEPIVTGSSVLGIRYKDGVMLAADTLASYGNLARFRDISRLHQVNQNTLIGASGDMSDFQYVQNLLEKLIIEEESLDDPHKLTASEIYEYLRHVMYTRRTKHNPLWNMFIVAGYSQKEGGFLAYVDLKGTPYTASTIATGYGAYIAQPLLRKHVEGKENVLTEEQARKIMEESLRTLFYRDCRALNRIQIATATAEGIKISEPYLLDTEWEFGRKVSGYD